MSIQQGDSYYRTQDTRLVACLTSVGFSLFHNPSFHKHVDPIRNKQKLTWCVNPLSDCGKKKVTDYANAYHDPFFFKSDDYKGMDDFKQAVASLKNRELLIDMVNNADAVMTFKTQTGFWYVPEKAGIHEKIIEQDA